MGARRSNGASFALECGAARALRRALLFVLAFGLAGWIGSTPGCGGNAVHVEPALLELEQLAFVPAGQVTIPVAGRGTRTIDVPRPLLVDRFEVTRRKWREFRRARGAIHEPEMNAVVDAWPETTDAWPASYMNHPEASDFARWRGMRLLTSSEWLYVAIGPQRLAFPWGATDQRSIANTLELNLDRPANVGTFEAGRTPHLVYDMLGNVAEWSADLAPSRDSLPGDRRVSVLGGSFRNRSRPILEERQVEGQSELFARSLAPESRADDVGLRCCADAAALLPELLSGLRVDETTRPRLMAVGQRWGRRAVPLLEELRREPTSPPALDLLLAGARK